MNNKKEREREYANLCEFRNSLSNDKKRNEKCLKVKASGEEKVFAQVLSSVFRDFSSPFR